MTQTTKASVLVVDDAVENIDLLVAMLNSRFIVKAARSGQVALKIAGLTPPPDLILLDINMPEMDGFDVNAALKQNADTADIPVIMLSGTVGAEVQQRAQQAGVRRVLQKPANPGELFALIDDILAGGG